MARQPNTNATRADWAEFARWCLENGEPALPAAPRAVAEYVRELVAGRHGARIPQRVRAIDEWHRASGVPSPTGDDRVRLAVMRAEYEYRKVSAARAG